MRDIISADNLSFIKKAIKDLSFKVGIKEYGNVLWLVFGSYVINMNKDGSDLDIIGIHNDFSDDERLTYNFQNVPIHATLINMRVLRDDGEKRLFGSYFSGKVINPHIFLYGDPASKKEAICHSGKFIASLAGYLGKLSHFSFFNDSQLTALVFIAYLSTDPSFDSYLLNYFSSPIFPKIWKSLCKTTAYMLKVAKEVTLKEKKYTFVNKFDDYKDFHSERMKISARHWSYGAVCHGGDREFQDKIFFKAEEKMKKIDPSGIKYQEMLSFLKQESGLTQVYV